MIYGLAIFFIVLAVDLFTDIRLYYKNKKVNHIRGAIFRVIGLAPAVWLMGWLSIPMLFFAYLILFNGTYNIFINRPWEFLGTTSELDRLQKKIPKFIKYLLLIISIYLYVKFGS
jgi:hypothetical protein